MELIPAGGRVWACGGWELRQQSDRLWVALRGEGERTTPPLFAQSLPALHWLVESWEKHMRSIHSSAAAYAKKKFEAHAEDEAEHEDVPYAPLSDEVEVAGELDGDLEPVETEPALQVEPLPSDGDGQDSNGMSDRVAKILARRRMALAG